MSHSHPPTRRELLTSGTLFTAGLLGSAACARAAQEPALGPSSAPPANDPLESAYIRFHAGYPRETVERSSHAPMVVEALAGLGRADTIEAWLDVHLEQPTPEKPAQSSIRADDWKGSLGKVERFVDWRELFLAELRHDDWRAMLRRWGVRLAPGLSAAAFHGVIRAGHAARALAGRDNELRRAELATGMAYWASSYLALPWDGSVTHAASALDAVRGLRTRVPELERPRGNLVAGLRSLEGLPSFLPVAGRVDVHDPARALSEIVAAFAHVYLRHPERRVAFAHAVTGPSAVQLLVPYLSDEGAVAAARYAWQAAAGLYVAYGDARTQDPPMERPVPRAELVAACIANGAPHCIKLTEVCLREHSVIHDPILLAAARDAARHIRG